MYSLHTSNLIDFQSSDEETINNITHHTKTTASKSQTTKFGTGVSSWNSHDNFITKIMTGLLSSQIQYKYFNWKAPLWYRVLHQ